MFTRRSARLRAMNAKNAATEIEVTTAENIAKGVRPPDTSEETSERPNQEKYTRRTALSKEEDALRNEIYLENDTKENTVTMEKNISDGTTATTARKNSNQLSIKCNELKRSRRASLSLEELLKLREKDAQRKRKYRANLSNEKKNAIRIAERKKKRLQRAQLSYEELLELRKKDANRKRIERENSELERALELCEEKAVVNFQGWKTIIWCIKPK